MPHPTKSCEDLNALEISTQIGVGGPRRAKFSIPAKDQVVSDNRWLVALALATSLIELAAWCSWMSKRGCHS